MKISAFHVQMYKGILDSGWIQIEHLTVLVGKNESGKTSLLKALHKLNPFTPEPYSMAREWPRGHRDSRSETQTVCTARFLLGPEELAELKDIIGKEFPGSTLEISRNYKGQITVHFPDDLFSGRLRPNQVDDACSALPAIPAEAGTSYRTEAEGLRAEVTRLGYEGRFSELEKLPNEHSVALQKVMSPADPPRSHEQQHLNSHVAKVTEIVAKLKTLPKDQAQAHEYITGRLPTFIYMDDYRVFSGTALLDQVKQRVIDAKKPTEEDKSLLTIMELAGLRLEEEVRKGNQTSTDDKEQRQYDLDDAGATLTRMVEGRWKSKKYEVKFGADGQHFFTFVKDENDRALIRLEERSKGFQWFFSFDLMFMYESKGQFEGCVLLLDEPGLHLHPDAQKDLLKRLEAYAEGNTLLYTTHLPFMIDLRQPTRIRAVSETSTGTVVTEDLNASQPEARFSLQAALGMSASSSYLLAQRNLVVEGVDDYWIISELSNILIRSGEAGLPDDVFITAARGASEVAYVSTFMIGQELDVVALLDSDRAGDDAKDHLVKAWLTRYKNSTSKVLSLGSAVGQQDNKEFALEDLFPDEYYLGFVHDAYRKELKLADVDALTLQGHDQLAKRVERSLQSHGIEFNKGRVAKLMRNGLARVKDVKELPPTTQAMAKKLVASVTDALPELRS